MAQLQGSLCISRFQQLGCAVLSFLKAFLCSKDVDSLLALFNMVRFLRRKKLLFVKMRTSSIQNSYKSQQNYTTELADCPGP